ncbi:unnamed protein product [Macrosiphum euphorbiae]|uniref:Uncharacterized protein n=1 Tax=Macrosiphum euphorbiae TaxID=13131 RepID=A0AAV0Y5L9_9HEMI|nr:unnamed protein product [Macrosiphum euphorbiae]
MEYGDQEPVNIPTLNALRVMKHKVFQKSHIHQDLITALSLLKNTVNYNIIIYNMGYDRFFLHYWTSTEINTYTVYTKKKIPRITIDATGGLVRKFLYDIGIMDYKNKCQFLQPICYQKDLIQQYQLLADRVVKEQYCYTKNCCDGSVVSINECSG